MAEKDQGSAPKSGWAKLVSEILVEDFDASLSFWRHVLGFEVSYRRPSQKFAYLDLRGAQIMICQRSGKWETAGLERPFGRGVMFQIYVDDLDRVVSALSESNWPIYRGPREAWRQVGEVEIGQREIFVQDPDGYLLMLAEEIGQRPIYG